MFPQLFHRLSTKKSQEKNDVTETFRTLIDSRFNLIEEKMARFEREWSDVYDKIMLLYDRTRKRIAAQKKLSEDVPDVTNGIEPVLTLQSPEEVMAEWRRQQGAR